MSQGFRAIVLEDSREFFVDRVEEALRHLRFDPRPSSRSYLVDLLQHFMFSSNMISKGETLAEIYLQAQNSPPAIRHDLLKKLGDSSLYISGFFGDSLSRKVVDIDYYVDMGGVAYGALASGSQSDEASQMYEEFASRFTGFVDVLTYISQESLIQTNGDLLKLYDRYIATGSRLAQSQLLEKGLLSADLQKSKASKQ